MSKQPTIEDQLRDRCKELEARVKNLTLDLESKSRTEFTSHPVVNPQTGEIELYSVVSIVSHNNVTPLFRRGILNTEENSVLWIPLEEVKGSV